VLAVALALASSVVWGTADFLGGITTRRLALAPVVVVSQLAGLVALVAGTALVDGFDARAFGIGTAAGVCGAVGIASFYRALATGTISIVSPISACSALVPVGLALIGGERPGAAALIGSAVALAGAVLASVHEYSADHPAARGSVLLAATAALGIGGFLFFIAHAARGDHALPALLGGRCSSLGLLLAGALVTRSSVRLPPAEVPLVAAIGLMDVGANALFVAASQRGYLSVVAVLGSEYPVVTVLLAQALLGERVTRVQAAGIGLALAGVGIVSVT
jgi:drug/metabolite transporter (DMT)-like permease